MALGVISTHSFNVSSHFDVKPLIPNVPFNMYTEGEIPTPWGFPGHANEEVLLTIINNTACTITLNQWVAGLTTLGTSFDEFSIPVVVMPGTSTITYEMVRSRLPGFEILSITNSVARFHVDGWPNSIDHGVTRIKYNGPGTCACVLVTFDALNHILRFDPC